METRDMINGKKGLSIIIPAYNESKGIGGTLKELTEAVDMEETEIIVIDDGSTDDTAEIVLGFSGVKLIRHRKNQGYGTSIRTGVRAAKGDIIAWYDADGQHRPEDLKAVVDEVKVKGKDYCIGVRGKDSYEDYSRLLGKMVLRLFLWLFIHQQSADFNSGLRAFRRSIMVRYLTYLPKRFGGSTVTTLLMEEERYNGSEVPITVRRRIGKSSVKQVKDGFNTILLMINIVLLFHPIHLFGGLGSFSIMVGCVYGAYCSIKFGYGMPVFSAVLILLGVQFLCFGMLSQQISRLRRDRVENEVEIIEVDENKR